MFRIKPLNYSFVILLPFLFILPGYCSTGVGKALEEALKSRSTGTTEEVIASFQNAADISPNPEQKANVLGLLADYLMEKKEWAKAIEVDERILAEGTDVDKPGAYYGEAQAFLMLNQPEKAKAICARLQADHPDNTMASFANYIKEIAPNSIHARLADFLAEAPRVVGRGGPDQTPGQPGRLGAPVLPLPPNNIVVGPDGLGGPGSSRLTKRRRVAALQIGARLWNSDLYGHINSKGMSLDLNNDTDIERQTSFAVTGTWNFSGRDRLRIDYGRFDNSGNLNRAVTFDQLSYGVGSSLNMNVSFFDAGLSRLLEKSRNGSWKLLYGVKFTKSFMRVSTPTVKGTQSGEINSNFGVPYLGVEGETRLSNNLILNGSAKYFSLTGGKANGRLTDFDVSLLFGRDYEKNPAETEWYGTLGYRYFLLQGEADNDSAEIRYSGPTLGLEGRF